MFNNFKEHYLRFLVDQDLDEEKVAKIQESLQTISNYFGCKLEVEDGGNNGGSLKPEPTYLKPLTPSNGGSGNHISNIGRLS